MEQNWEDEAPEIPLRDVPPEQVQMAKVTVIHNGGEIKNFSGYTPI